MSTTTAPPAPPATASATYKALHTTALSFIAAQALDPSLPTRLNFAQLTSLCDAASFTHSFGHRFAVSLTPPLHGAFSLDAFTAHLRGMLARLESWDARVGDVLVDEAQKRVVLRVAFGMRAKGVDEAVENDVVWVLGLVEHEGAGWKVGSSVEFVDGVAAARLRELMARGEQGA